MNLREIEPASALRLRRGVLVAWALSVALTLLSLAPLQTWLRNLCSIVGDDGGRMVLSALAATACFSRMRHGDGAYTKTWAYFGWSLAVTGIGDLLIVISRVGDFQAHAGVFYSWYSLSALGTVLLGGGLLMWPVRSNLKGDRMGALLSGLTVGLAAFTVLWAPLFQRVLESSSYRAPWLAVLWLMTYLALATIWLTQEARSLPHVARAPRRQIRLALGLLVACVVAYTYLRLKGYTLTLGPPEITDLCWLSSLAFFGLAATSPRETQGGPMDIPSERAAFPGFLAYLPVTIASLMALGLAWRSTGLDRVSATVLALLCLVFTLKEFVHHRHLVKLSQDLEERVRERTEDLARIQLEQLSLQRTQLVATLAAGVVHDLKNALGVMDAWLKLYREDRREETREECLDALEQALQQAIRLVKEQLSAGVEVPCHPKAFRLKAHCEVLRPLLETSLHPHALVLDIPESLPSIWMDPGHLDQILLNLASNARDVLGPGGTFVLRASQDPLEPRLLLEAVDNGCGMSEEVLAKVFKPFFTTKLPGQGTGLGLASVQALVIEAGGRIQVRSSVGEGTVFSLQLPLAKPS